MVDSNTVDLTNGEKETFVLTVNEKEVATFPTQRDIQNFLTELNAAFIGALQAREKAELEVGDG